jgi:hypothetical protein
VQGLRARERTGCRRGIRLNSVHQHANAPHGAGLCARRERPGGRRSAEQRDELAAFHSITSSARRRKDSGIVRSNALVAVR